MYRKIDFTIRKEDSLNFTKNLDNSTCVYMLLFNNGSYYIGNTKDLKSRIRGHLKSMDGSKCVSILLRVAFKKSGLPKVITVYKGNKQDCQMIEGKLLNLTYNDDLSLNDNKSKLYKQLIILIE